MPLHCLPGADKVAAVLSGSAMTAVNLSEAVGYYARAGAPEVEIRAMFDVLRFERVLFDEELAYIAGMMLPKTRAAGLSFGDRACLALAVRIGGTVWTADRAWPTVARAIGVRVELIR